jgi:predicted transcriptional regulator
LAKEYLSMKRDKLEIIRSILLICKNGGARKTKIVYEANLNFKTADVYLKLLMDQKMIIKEEEYFKTTPKGAKLLSDLKNVSASLDLKQWN